MTTVCEHEAGGSRDAGVKWSNIPHGCARRLHLLNGCYHEQTVSLSLVLCVCSKVMPRQGCRPGMVNRL